MKTGSTIIRFLLLFCFGFCANGFAQSESTLSQFANDSFKNRAPFKLAQKSDNPGAAKNLALVQKAADKKPLPNVGKERRSELMAFVKEHHPEIRPILNSLQKTRPSKYQSTLRTLDREVKALQWLETRSSPERYKKSLAHWITKSKILLLSARLAIKKSLKEQQAIEKQLFVLIKRRQDLQIEMTILDMKITEKRLAKYKADLAKLNENQNASIERQLELIKNTSQRRRLAQQKAADAKKNAASTNSKPANDKPPVKKKDKSRIKDDKAKPQG